MVTTVLAKVGVEKNVISKVELAIQRKNGSEAISQTMMFVHNPCLTIVREMFLCLSYCSQERSLIRVQFVSLIKAHLKCKITQVPYFVHIMLLYIFNTNWSV